MNRDNDSLKNWLVFSKSEKRGISILLLIILILLTIRIIQKLAPNKVQTKSIPIEYYNLSDSVSTQDIRPTGNERSITQQELINRQIFDPNQASREVLIRQGIPKHITNRIIRYRNRGGVFYNPTDVYKIYGIDSSLVEELLNWIVIESESEPTSVTESKATGLYSGSQKIFIEINSSDSSILCELPGIGPVLSRRIIKYRELLGGFYNVDQLTEVYGISDSLFNAISNMLTVDTSKIRSLDLNNASLNDFKNHPYLTNYEAKAIMSYRRLVGPYTSRNQLTENYILSENTYNKVRYYLRLN